MMRLALAMLGLSALALAGAGSPPRVAPKTEPSTSPPPKIVRAVAVAGSGQSGRAYADSASPRYATEFPKMLVVRVVPKPGPGEERHVKFRCITDRCAFAAADQPVLKLVEHPLPGVYDITATADGTAQVRITLLTYAVAGTYTVRAEPVENEGEHAVDTFFTLRTH
jgi:hypothetical protein